jgi:hypothetical protein
MNALDYSIPPYRELPPGRLTERRRHLLTAIALRPKFAVPVRRVALLAGPGACAAAAVALALSLSGGSSKSNPRFLIRATHSPVWSVAHVNLGQPTCSVLAELAVGCRGTLAVPAATQRQLPARVPAAAATVVRGGTANQRKLLRSILDGMRGNGITQIAIEPSKRTRLTLRMTATAASGEAYWQEALVAAAFRHLSKVTVALKAGTSNGAPLAPTLVSPPRPKPGDVKAARRRFQAAAEKIGVPLEALTVYRPDGVAISAVLEADDPAAFLLHTMPRFLAAMGDPWRDYDGVYVRLVDASGATVWETSTVVRMSEGSIGAREDLAGCSPVSDWGPTPPPCPAK